MKTAIIRKTSNVICMIVFIFMTGITLIQGQVNGKYSVKGHLQDDKMVPLPFATVALMRLPDSTLFTGTSSDVQGDFSIEQVTGGKYILLVTMIGYQEVSRDIEIKENFNTGSVTLSQTTAALGEVVILGERLKARKDADKTTWMINEKLTRSSATGTGLLSFIPGIQIDLMKNISLNGSKNVILLVDGIERDKNFLDQISPEKIDKIEILNSPGPRFDGSVTGVINVILKESSEKGVNGSFYAEAPLTRAVYSFPDYSLNFRMKRLELYTSYNGAMSYFDVIESENRSFLRNSEDYETRTIQYVRQKDWSHRFHVGADYRLNDRDHLVLYGFINPFSREMDGLVDYQATSGETIVNEFSFRKDDTDKNNSDFFSIYYKHTFGKAGRELSFELNSGHFRASNSTSYINILSQADSAANFFNSVKPLQNSSGFRIDFINPISQKGKLTAGLKGRTQKLQDRKYDAFRYKENLVAAYSSLTVNLSRFTVRAGLRSEYSLYGIVKIPGIHDLIFFPQASLNMDISQEQKMELSYNKTVSRPNIYQLNPYTGFSDPDGLTRGNPQLEPETQHNIKFEYSVLKGDNLISAGLFFTEINNIISQYAYVNDGGSFESVTANLGEMYGGGIQFNSSLRITKWLTVNPSLRVYEVHIPGANKAPGYIIPVKNKLLFDSGLSAIGTFKHDISASLLFQYNSPSIRPQNCTFSDPLWMISLDKNIGKNFKIGFTTGLPLVRKFTYRGSEIKEEDLNLHYEGNLKLPLFPTWFKLRYQFSSGAKTGKNVSQHEDIITIPKKGM